MANSAARKASRTETTPDKNFLEERVKYLEAEVKTLNKRLDTLRAAKNNTVIKATTKYVPSSEPKTHDGAAELARKQESEELRNLRLKVKKLEGILAKERIMFKTELETFQKLKMEEQVQNTNCERHEALILSLQTENVQLQVQVTIYFETRFQVSTEKLENCKRFFFTVSSLIIMWFNRSGLTTAKITK